MPTRKRVNKKKLQGKGRTNDAVRWLRSKEGPHCKYVSKYSKRYGVDACTARDELISLGYYEDIFAEELEAEGKELEYIVNPLTGDLVPVEAGTEEYELFM
jgi:hypothetical protein